jgi:hypothetical protein
MSNLNDIKTDIAEDLDAADGYYDAAIIRAIKEAIRFHGKELFYFNEVIGMTFNTVSGQEFYDVADHSDIPNLRRIENMWTVSGSGRRALCRNYNTEIDGERLTQQRQPFAFAYANMKIRLYPIPDAIYTVKLDGWKSISEPDDWSLETEWANEAYDLILARASAKLSKNTIIDRDRARDREKDEAEALQALRTRTDSAISKGYITGDAML